MKNLDFKEVANLIKYSQVTEISDIPIASQKSKWALFKGTNKVPNFNYPFFILYLYSDFTKESAISAYKAVEFPSATQIVHASSVNQNNIKELLEYFGKNKVSGVRDLKTYLFTFIKDQMQVYNEKLKELKPEFFIDPPYITPSGFKKKVPNPVYSFMSDETEDLDEGCLGILLAEPGQGKTHTTKYLTCKLIENGFIPVYIHSSQWFELKEYELSSLYKTIVHSFRYFGVPINWLENIEEEFINISLKLGLFKIIFDGFDEFVLWNKGKVNPDEIISKLSVLASESNARILITSRTTFWNSSIQNSKENKNLFIYSIEPFDENHANNYFKQRFRDEKHSYLRSKELFGVLKSKSKSKFAEAFAGRGFVLSLIADLCSSDSNETTYDGNISIIQWIMLALCQREEIRQKLPINANEQLKVFQQFAEYRAMGEEPNTNLMRLVLEIVCTNLNKIEIDNLVSTNEQPKSLNDHPLIYKVPFKDLWYFKHEQIEFNLIAEQITAYINTKSVNPIRSFFQQLSNTGSLIDDLCLVIYEQISSDNNLENIKKKGVEIIDKLINLLNISGNDPQKRNNLNLFITKFISIIFNKISPLGLPKSDRTKVFLELIHSSGLETMQFSGYISSVDFSNIEFKNCRFDKVVWSNCILNERTKFISCYFLGGEIHNCVHFGSAEFVKCFYDKEAESIINHEKIKEGIKISRDDIKRDIELFLRRFVPKEGLFKERYEDEIIRGQLSAAPHKDLFLKTMYKYVIEEQGKKIKIKDSAKASINHYLNNGLFNGNLAKSYNELVATLKAQ